VYDCVFISLSYYLAALIGTNYLLFKLTKNFADTSRPIPPRSSYNLTITSEGDPLLVSCDEGRIFSGFQLYEERKVSCKILQATFKPNLTDIESYFNSRAQCIDLCRYDKNCSFVTYGGNMQTGKNCLVYKKQYCRHPNTFTIENLVGYERAVDSYQKLGIILLSIVIS